MRLPVLIAWLFVLLAGTLALPEGSAARTGLSRAVPAAAPGAQRNARIEVELVPMNAWAAPGSTAVVALRQKIQPGWHTYWRNPGDSGGPTTLDWSLPPGVLAGDILWPLPRRQRLDDIVNLGYQDQVFLPVPIDIPASARPGTQVPLTVTALLFVCSDEMCVPDSFTLRLDLPIRDGTPPLVGTDGAAIQRLVESAPRPAGITAHATLADGRLVLSASGGPLTGADIGRATFYPFEAGLIDHDVALTANAGPDGLGLTLAPTSDLVSAGLSEPLAGVLATDAGAWEISAVPGTVLPGTTGRSLATADGADGASPGVATAAQAIVFALLGGLILNLMPCVFPVLALKAAALARSSRSAKEARADGLAYLAGVLVTFLLLGATLLLLRGLGQEIGWGFQLQSPPVVAILALLMLVVGLNLAGLFQIGLGLQAAGGSRLSRLNGPIGAFLTGILAVVVSAPCTAPFMAVALGAALVLPAPIALLVFLFLGLGLALPYLAVSLSPGVLARLPRPGPWMERLQRILAVPMFAAAVWLGWVFLRQQGWTAALLLMAGAAFMGAAVWAFGHRQREMAAGGPGRPLMLVSALTLIVALGVTGVAASLTPPARTGAGSGNGPATRPWSPMAVAEARAQGRPVLVDFTADWCVSCKINERTSLHSPRVADAIARTGTVYLVADWTRRDPTIARELASHGRSGVPLYLVYAPDEARPRILPQLLTEGVVIEALEATRSSARPTGRPAAAGR
ncbi:protein-disulfide reductase DsbD family protein [Brevundimonas subvibrioides]|uniref:protein-disulfide reductase DsbD family protein n=1 Tax=Brevundimonas subvibrioides TaxID=74313 RepID=UPI0022B3D37E|nr:thioredoxin family protein [Brevundimonas subvibrioides]